MLTPNKPLQAARKLSWFELISYALPAASTSLMIIPLVVIFPTVYNKFYGVPLEALGPALLISRLVDAFLDPVTAYLSDKTKTRLGARKPWMIAGVFIAVVGVYFLFIPQGTPDALYFMLWSTVVYIGWTLIAIPHGAWGAEISGNYDERSKVATVSGMVGAVGGTLFFAAPIFLPFDTEEITPEVLRYIGYATMVFVPISVWAAVSFAPAGKPVTSFDTGLWDTIKGIWRNKPFMLFLAIFTLQGVALGIYSALLYPFVDGYLHIGDMISRIIILATIANFVSIPVWLWVCNRYGKHLAWAIGSATTNLVLLAFLFLNPGPESYVPVLVINIIYGLLSSCASVCYPSILADIIDYGTLKTGSNRAGSYQAIVLLVVKSTAAIGGSIALSMVGFFGFSTEAGAVNDQWANTGLLLTFIGLHTLLQMIAIPLIWYFPIDKRRQQIIRKRVEARAAREAIAHPVPLLP